MGPAGQLCQRNSWFTHFHSFFLCLKYEFVDLLLFWREFPRDWNGTCNVSSIAMILSTKVHQNQLFGSDIGFIVINIMENAAVVTGTNDGRISNIFSLIFFKYILVNALDLSFRHPGFHGLHYFNLSSA